MNLMKVKSSFLEQIRIRQNNPAQRRILRCKSRSRNDTARNLALRILEFQILKPASFWLPQKRLADFVAP